MSEKVFLTVTEQVTRLKERGLSVPDENAATAFLKRNNYYRVSGYSLTLRDHDEFYPSATFQNIVDIYEFDAALRHILLEYIETIEITVKSLYAYEFAKRHGPLEYRNKEFFTSFEEHKRILKKADEQKNLRHSQEAYLKHYIDELGQEIPLWVYVELMTISDISCLYAISENDVRFAVARGLGFKNNNGPTLISKFMHNITILRNLCAHGARIYNRLFEQKPLLDKDEFIFLRDMPNGTKDNSHLFGFIIIIKRFLKPNVFVEMKNKIQKLERKFPFVSMKYYGFPNNWAELL